MDPTTELRTDPFRTIPTIIRTDWYQLLSDTDKAEFWTQAIMTVGAEAGVDAAVRVGESMDQLLEPGVTLMVVANLRALSHRNQA